jgi:hypothetical protein
MRRRFAVCAALLLFAASCAAPPEKAPEPEDRVVSPDRYLTAEGIGATEAEARREALSALAGIFESRVYSETASAAASFISEGAPEAFEKSVESRVKIESSVRLRGARIGSIRRDAQSGLFHAQAVLDRRQAAREWSDQLAMVDTRMNAEISALSGLSGRLTRMGALNRILAAALEKAALRSRLRVIGMAPLAAEDPDLQPIADEAAALRSTAEFFVNINGDRAAAVADRIEQALGAEGIPITREPAQAAGAVNGSVETAGLDLGNRDVHFVRMTLRMTVVDVDTGTQVAAISEDIRKGHVDEKEAVRMAAAAVSDRAAERLLAVLGLMGFSQEGRNP